MESPDIPVYISCIYCSSAAMKKEGCREFWSQFWCKMEAVKVLSMLLGFALYIQRTLFIKWTIEEMMNNIGELVVMFEIYFVLSCTYHSLMSQLIMIST